MTSQPDTKGQGEGDAGPLKWRVFGLTWVSYASYYFTRKNFSVAKRKIELDSGINREALGQIDTGYLLAYSVGQFLCGFLADRIGARRVIALGMMATALCSMCFGLSSSFLWFALFFGINGLAQSTGWPSNLKAMAEWFPRSGRGAVMGFWSTCYQFGSLVANPIAGFFLVVTAVGWRMAFFGPAVWVFGVGLIVLLALPERLNEGKKKESKKIELSADEIEMIRSERRRVLRTPLLWALGTSYFSMKLIRYILLFWLPYYMEQSLQYSSTLSANVPLAFEAGGLLGSITIGFISDRYLSSRRLGISLLFLLILGVAMPLYATMSHRGVTANVLGLALVGFSLFGPDTLVSATAAQDVGGPRGAATAGGVINGTGSIGPILGSAMAAPLSLKYGWDTLWVLLGGCAIVGALPLLPFYWKERGSRG